MRRPRFRTAQALAFAAALAATPDARAGGTGMEGLQGLAYLAAAVIIADVAFTVYDGVQMGRGELPSRGVAVAELLLCGPQVFGGLAFAASSPSTRGPGLAFTAWTTALSAHGVWGIVTPRGGSGASAPAPGAAPASWSAGLAGTF
jgi:hypothetical protein